MQAYEGYYENGQFYPIGKTAKINGRRRAFITILDEPAKDKDIEQRLQEFDELMEMIRDAADEEMPEIEWIKFREVEL